MSRQLPPIPTRNGMKRPRSRGAQSPTLADVVVDRIAGLSKLFIIDFNCPKKLGLAMIKPDCGAEDAALET